jgi:hypothetical protein
VTLPDVAGIAGVLLILVAYAGVQFRRLDPLKAPALMLNFFGAALVLLSLVYEFNLAAFVMESVWCLIALWGLGRLALARRQPD